MRGSRKFCQFYLILSLFYSLQRESNGFIAENTILILYQGSRGGPLFSRGGWGGLSNLFQGVQMLISIETHIRTCHFPGGSPDPLSPSGSAHGQCYHDGTIFITVPLLTMVVRHDLSGLMIGVVFQMMHCYCARLTHSRNTALGSGSFCNSAFFLQNIHYLNAVSRTISVTG